MGYDDYSQRIRKEIYPLSLKNALIISIGLTVFVAEAGLCHDFWIEPGSFMPQPGETVDVRLREGVNLKGNTLPFIPEWFTDFSTVSNIGRTPVESIIGDDPAAVIAVPKGALLMGYRSTRNFVDLDADKFNRYLDEEGIEFIREQRRNLGQDDMSAPEYFVRCAKALIQASAGGDEIYATELGYILELVAEDDPYKLRPGDEINFRLIYRGEPAAGLLVQAFTRDNPDQRQRIRTDANGRATIQLSEAGIWMIKAVNIQPIIGDPKALWQSYWASYLFELADSLPKP